MYLLSANFNWADEIDFNDAIFLSDDYAKQVLESADALIAAGDEEFSVPVGSNQGMWMAPSDFKSQVKVESVPEWMDGHTDELSRLFNAIAIGWLVDTICERAVELGDD